MRDFSTYHARTQKVLLEGFLVDEGKEIPNTTKSEPSSACHRNAMAFRWRADDGPTLNAGLVTL